MTHEALTNDHLREQDMDPEYRQAEETYREQAARFFESEQDLRKQARADVNATEEERQERYMEGFKKLKDEHEAQANAFTEPVLRQRTEWHETLYKGRGEKFAELLVQVSSMPDDKLEELLTTALKTGQEDLAQAIGVTAEERNLFASFNRWAKSDPERAEALQKLRSTPGFEQLYDRTHKAMQPHKAGATDLLPGREDLEQADQRRAAAEAGRKAFFGLPPGPRRQVGSRTA